MWTGKQCRGRRLFELAAAGVGYARIARQLNAERALAPQSQRDRPAGWAPSSVREVLIRDLYRGEIVWHRTRKRNRWGEKAVTDRPADEWIRVPAPALRIVSDALKDWRGLLKKRHEQGRQVLQKLIVGPLVFTPQESGLVAYKGTGTLKGLLLDGQISGANRALLSFLRHR